ncbi:MAG: beta-propeller fold lactonase family protein [Bacteroidales bacterium]
MMKKLWFLILSLLLLGVLQCCIRQHKKPGDLNQGVIIVANKSGNDVWFIDRETGEVLVKLPTGTEPHEVEVSDDGKTAVVCNYGDRDTPGNTLTVYDIQGGILLRTIDLGLHTRPHGMKWIAGSQKLLVTTEGSQHLLMVNTETGKTEKAFFTDQEISHMVAATPDFKRAFVPSIRTGNVTVFDLDSGELIAQVYSGKGAEGVDVSPDGKELWVTNRADNNISVFDTRTLEQIALIPCEDFPIRAKFTPDGKKFVVSNARSGTIAVFDALSKELISTIKLRPPVPADTDSLRYFAEFEGTSIPIGLVIPDNETAYVANTRSDAVTVIDLMNLEIKGHFQAGNEPDGINFSWLKPEIH